nr:glycosyltransferase family 9 protein [Gemmatimonadota bacterium]NIQ53573.1 glycosyltransferase family 9 protein [Gemmatimonadota bacterium]NIU73730.1 glycosyl transferase [Gammaproteobacteria bacterium]NIX43871.1 glycosyl transferase [Gemmatimonadota bacterium]NIY08085.1 glycosyl transferase [Gemmatimonadota bacterium]
MSAIERFREEPPRELLVVMLSALGDAVHVLPVVNALKRAWPETRITWLIQPVPFRLVRDHPAVDRFVVFRRRKGLSAWRSFRDAGRQLRDLRFDLVLALQVYAKAGLLTALTRADVKLGFDRARARDLNWLVTNERIPPHPVQHVQDQYFEFLEHLGVDPEPVEWRVPIGDEDRAAQRAFFGSLDRPACAIVVGTSKPEKNWAAERYARTLDALESDFGMRPVLVGGPSAVEREKADAILERTGARVIDTLGDDLRRLVWMLDGASLVISPDTGPLHLARALDTPVVGLYGYTNPKRYGPYRKYEDLVVDGYARYPGEEYPPSMEYRAEGMERVSVEEVLGKVERAGEVYG